MRSRYRSTLSLVLPLFMVAALVAGCAHKKDAKSEIRLPKTSMMEDRGASSGQDTADASSQDGAPSFGPGEEWQPGDAPSGDSLVDTASMGPGGDSSFALDDSNFDSETGSLLNNTNTDGVEDGSFTSELETVHFPFDSSEIPEDYISVLNNHAQWIKNHSSVMVQIEGHCDERGTEEYNLSLGQRRADAVREYLVDKGVDPDRLSTISYGEMRPLTFDQTEEAHALNRRAMFLVYEVSENEGNNVAAAY